MAQKTLELLESLMAGQVMSPDKLDELLREQVTEDLFLDYKHGNELSNAKKARRTVREYLSGFANSAGGTLIIGVDENTWSVTGCSAPGGGDLAKWAASCFTKIAHYFSPPPRFQVIEHPDGDVLVASTDRSLVLVPCREGVGSVYHLRFHDQTLKAPEYLVADLTQGRRQRPHLHITECSLRGFERLREPERETDDLRFSLEFELENDSLSWAEDVRLGIIALAKGGANIPLSSHLLSYVEIREPNKQRYSDPYQFNHNVKPINKIEPFEVQTSIGSLASTVPLSMARDWYIPYIWKAAAYTISKGSPPVWY